MHRAVVPVATMLAIQVMISLSVLSLSVMMPAVAGDLAIDPKLVGVFTAIIYGVAAVTALAAAGPIVRLGAVRVCQAALLMAAIGLALNALALVVATVIAVMFIGAAQGPINPSSAHILSQRVPREWFGMVFSLKQTGVPIGFALAGLIFPQLLELVGWRGASLVAAGAAVLAALVLEPLRPGLDVIAAAGRPSNGIWRSVGFVMGHRATARARLVGFRLRDRPAHLHLLPGHLSLPALRPQHRPRRLPALDLATGGHGGAPPERRHGRSAAAHAAPGLDRRADDARLRRHRAAGSRHAVLGDHPGRRGYGSVVISWNGTSQAEFAHLSPPGEAASVAAVQTALAFSGAVFGPPIFALIASLVSYRMAFFAVAACVLAAALWQIAAARRPQTA